MDTPRHNLKLKDCKKHNLPIVFIDQQLNLPMCHICVQDKTGMIPIDQMQQKSQEMQINGNKEFQKELQQFKQLQDSILNYKESMIKGIDKTMKFIIDQIQNIQISQQKFDQQFIANSQLINFELLRDQLKNQEDYHNKVKIQIKQQLTEFQQKYNNIDYLKKILTQSNEIIVKQDDEDKRKQKVLIYEGTYEKFQNLGKFEYELIQESRMKKSEFYYAMAFNKDDTILIIGCGSMIKIYSFINGKIRKKLQVLQHHKDDVYCLYFMKQSNCFVSGSRDKSMIIWKLDTKNQWVLYQILTDHIDIVNCLLMTKNEDLLISGSQDETVKFWKKNQDKWCCKQTIQTGNQVFAMSLNEMENKLISCGSAAFIYVMQIQDNNEWSKIQKIKVNQFCSRLCFTQGDQFVFQPETYNQIEIFDCDRYSNEFRKYNKCKFKVVQKIVIYGFHANLQSHQTFYLLIMGNFLIFLGQIKIRIMNQFKLLNMKIIILMEQQAMTVSISLHGIQVQMRFKQGN